MRSIAMAGALVAWSGLLAVAPVGAQAEPTEIVVRVLSKDAKFVGSTMGGVRIVLSDAETGEILARGVTSGGTGDTDRIMHEDGGRRARLSDGSAAKYVATLDLDEPRLIEAEAFGPLAQLQGAHRVSATQWVVPGRHLSAGDGWVLELPGFVVDLLDPPAHVRLPADTATVGLRANVVMMCGCGLEPDGLWDTNGIEVTALVRRNGEDAGSVELAYAGETSQFAGQVPVDGPGVYDVTVYAYDPSNGNTGLDRTTFIVPQTKR